MPRGPPWPPQCPGPPCGGGGGAEPSCAFIGIALNATAKSANNAIRTPILPSLFSLWIEIIALSSCLPAISNAAARRRTSLNRTDAAFPKMFHPITTKNPPETIPTGQT